MTKGILIILAACGGMGAGLAADLHMQHLENTALLVAFGSLFGLLLL